MTWARSEKDEDRLREECSQIDIPKQEVLKIPNLSSDEIDQTSQVEDHT